MRFARLSLSVALCLLSAAPAHAECAWVLWSGGKSNPKRGFESRQDCETLRTWELISGPTLHGTKRDSKEIEEALKSTDLQCLPDSAVTDTPSECNWMLWTYVPVRKTFATKQECEMSRDDANRTMAKAGENAFLCAESDTSMPPQKQHASVWLLMRP